MHTKFSILIYYVICSVVLFAVISCRGGHIVHQTEPLFLLTERVSISHPDNSGTGNPSGAVAAQVLSEQVNYTSATEESDPAWKSSTGALGADGTTGERLDTNQVYRLSGVTVVSRARFAPLREGLVHIDFAIRVPKGYLSDDYHIALTPGLWHNDSLVVLNEVVLRGKNFIKKQEEDYERYNDYISNIIDPSGYDTAFVNRRAVEKELDRRRKAEIAQYYSRWSLYQDYLKWRDGQQAKYDRYNIQAAAKLNNELTTHDKAYRTDVVRQLALGQDTTALSRQYREKRRKIIASSPAQRQIALGTVPVRYRDFYINGVRPADIEPLLPGKQDSARIASGFIMRDLVAMNEIKDSRRQEAFNAMVPVTYVPEAHYDAEIVPQWNFNYLYTTSYPVTAGLKTIHLTLNGHVMAVDGSSFTLQCTDTLSYVISSMDELADGSLLANPSFTDAQRQEYTHALGLLKNREYLRALNILDGYTDYNTALALTCLGYDQKAYDLLEKLSETADTADTHYLSAIVCCRLKNDHEAIKQLMRACVMDESKQFRAVRDPEINRLVKRYNLEL